LEKNSNGSEETKSIGFNFSSQIKNGNIIAITGEIGSGKTTFIKGALKGLGYSGNVNSPTYTLINEYNFIKYKVIHIDCYREHILKRWINIGIMDYLNDNNNILFIEWPEYISGILPKNIININIKHLSEFKRKIVIS